VDTPVAVRTYHLTRRFGNFTAVDHVSLRVMKGEIFGFLGANGAGKTTLIRMLCGLLLPSEGEGWVAGWSIRQQPETIKKHIGYMSQKFSLYEDLTVQENMEFYGGLYGLSRQGLRSRQQQLMEQLGLGTFAHRMTTELPLGIKQRLALACAILHDPPIVFLDEPTSGVDPKARRAFWELIYQLAEHGKTIFVTTHYMDEAEYCHRLSIMHQGRIIAQGSSAELRERYGKATMEEVFVFLVNQAGVPRQ